MSVYVGIDPGLNGGLAVIYPDEVLVFPTPVTDGKKREYLEQEMSRLIPALNGTRAAIEYQQAMPKQGVSSTFQTGMGYGLWRGILAALGISYVIVKPQEWRKVVGLTAGEDKGASVALAQRLFPSISDQLVGPRGGIKDGMAEALLIAEFRRRLG
jgi:hypothetical protein